MNYIDYKVVDVVGGWARGRSWVDGRHLRLGEVHERGSASEGVLGEVLYCLLGEAHQREGTLEGV